MPPFDRFELEIFNNILAGTAEEMGKCLTRSSFSPNIKERRDHSCAIFNSGGEMIAQAAHIPVHLGSMSFSVAAVLKEMKIADGDIFILNDPFKGGTHLPDITCVLPVFVGKRPEFHIAVRAHHTDVGGKTPGSMPLSTSIDEEGVVIPPTRIAKKGKTDTRLLEKITAPMRNRRERFGDLNAQIAALETGRKRLLQTVEKYGAATVRENSGRLIDYGEKMMRETIRKIPDGKYGFTDFLDDDGAGTQDIALKVEVEIKGGRAKVDFSGSSPPVRGCLNAPGSVTVSAVLYVFQCLAPDGMPLNAGPLRALKIVTDKDSILNAAYPSAIAGGNVETSQRVVDAVFGALVKAVPHKIQAASSGTMNNVTFGGTEGDFVFYETVGGGMGGRSGADGVSAVQTHMTNTLNTPIEAIERELPVRINSYSIRKRSGGRGKFRGGNGIVREYIFLSPATVCVITERRKHRPWGVRGGEDGKSGGNFLTRGGKEKRLPAKRSFEARRGDALRIETPGGGGWGKK
ncbi:MAG: hydantoinase B/oxoprolinase family protein [Thermodesulfobacteriota bacterium]